MYQMTEPCTKIIKHGLQSLFLKDYMIDNKPKSKVILEEMREMTVVTQYQQDQHELQVHKIEVSLIVVGGLSHNLTILLVWEKSQWSLKQIPQTTTKPSKTKMPLFGKEQ